MCAMDVVCCGLVLPCQVEVVEMRAFCPKSPAQASVDVVLDDSRLDA